MRNMRVKHSFWNNAWIDTKMVLSVLGNILLIVMIPLLFVVVSAFRYAGFALIFMAFCVLSLFMMFTRPFHRVCTGCKQS